ncbi:polyprenyl synthetase family protein [Crateriforma conspicua]|nr:farnesyl diphosphate synthase [Crateriforma conspicua]
MTSRSSSVSSQQSSGGASGNGASGVDASSQDATGMADLAAPIEAMLLRALDSEVVTGDGCPALLADAMRYALMAPGKRLRPALVLMAGQVCGIDPHSEAAWQLAPAVAAVEMIHAYSLIHDDLPAMDDDDLRRGRPTVHLQFDEATAILAGDALLTAAFATLADGIRDPALVGPAVRHLGIAAGATALVGGQSDDLQAERDQAGQCDNDWTSDEPGRLAALAHLEAIHRRKTGALIDASLALGGILAGADALTRKNLSNYAVDLGLAFQVVDDLLDTTSTADAMGKQVGKDAARGKLTYPGLLGVEASREKAVQLTESAVSHARLLGDGAWRLIKLAGYVLERTH